MSPFWSSSKTSSSGKKKHIVKICEINFFYYFLKQPTQGTLLFFGDFVDRLNILKIFKMVGNFGATYGLSIFCCCVKVSFLKNLTSKNAIQSLKIHKNYYNIVKITKLPVKTFTYIHAISSLSTQTSIQITLQLCFVTISWIVIYLQITIISIYIV